MKITKRQLKHIIKEEKAKLLKEQTGEIYDLPDYAEFMMLAVTDEDAAIDWLYEFVERHGPNRYTDREEFQGFVERAKELVVSFGESLQHDL